MSRNIPIPYFPTPPKEYTPSYLSDVLRSFQLYAQQLQNPGEGRNTRITLTDLPFSEFGLEPGALFNEEGDVKITLANKARVKGNTLQMGIGQVDIILI